MNITYCQNCGQSVNKLNDTEYKCAVCGQIYWNNPRSTAGVILLKDDKVLVAKRGIEPNKGKYDFPGGFLEYGEDPFHAARRELQEEAHITLGELELLAAYPNIYQENESVTDLLFVARDWQGEPEAHDDVAELVWQPLSFIDSEDFAPPYPGLRELLETRQTATQVNNRYPEASQIQQIITDSQHIVIVQADNPDGDSLASALALEQILGDLGKEPYLYCAVDMPTYLTHMAGWDRVSNELPHNFDASIIVDTSADSLLELLTSSGQKQRLVAKPSIVLDHHATEATIAWASVLCVQRAVATGEVIYELAQQLGWPLNLEAKNMLAVSIMADSLGLTSQATTARSIQIISELVAGGVSIAELENRRRELMRRSHELVKYKGELLQRIDYGANGRVAFITIPWSEIETYSPLYNPSVLVIDEMRMVEGVQVAIAFKVYRDGKLTAKIRCNYGASIAKDLAEHFGGGGHVYASGFKIQEGKPFNEVKSECVEFAGKLLDNLEKGTTDATLQHADS